jgi:transposase
VKSNLAVRECLEEQIERIEEVVLAQLKLREGFQPLLMVSGIGQVLGMTIRLETGEISRFATVGDFASYCRCVGSQKLSNGKRKGQGNTKNGNKYLAWAFVEAANFAVRYNAQIKRFYQRKQTTTNGVVAIKAVAHKLARACYYILRDQVPFEVNKAFT